MLYIFLLDYFTDKLLPLLSLLVVWIGKDWGGGFFEQDTLCLCYGVFMKISMALGYNFVNLLLINLCSIEYIVPVWEFFN